MRTRAWPGAVLVGGRGMTRADAQICRGDGHRIRGLPEVVLEKSRLPIVLRLWRDDRDRGRGSGDMSGAPPDLGQLDQLRPVGDEHLLARHQLRRFYFDDLAVGESTVRFVRTVSDLCDRRDQL